MEFEKVKKLIAEKMEIDEASITMETAFDEMQIDSLDMVEIIMDIEEEFDISIETGEGLKTVADLVEFIKKG